MKQTPRHRTAGFQVREVAIIQKKSVPGNIIMNTEKKYVTPVKLHKVVII